MCGSRIILTVQRAGYLLSPLRGNQGLNSARTHPQAYWPFRGNNPMWDKVVQFRRQAQDCKERAAGARDPIDGDAWLKLAEEWLAFARANEAARDGPKPPAINPRPSSE